MPIHPSHQTRGSDASTFDLICERCGATDEVPGGLGKLAEPCPAQKVREEAELLLVETQKRGRLVLKERDEARAEIERLRERLAEAENVLESIAHGLWQPRASISAARSTAEMGLANIRQGNEQSWCHGLKQRIAAAEKRLADLAPVLVLQRERDEAVARADENAERLGGQILDRLKAERERDEAQALACRRGKALEKIRTWSSWPTPEGRLALAALSDDPGPCPHETTLAAERKNADRLAEALDASPCTDIDPATACSPHDRCLKCVAQAAHAERRAEQKENGA